MPIIPINGDHAADGNHGIHPDFVLKSGYTVLIPGDRVVFLRSTCVGCGTRRDGSSSRQLRRCGVGVLWVLGRGPVAFKADDRTDMIDAIKRTMDGWLVGWLVGWFGVQATRSEALAHTGWHVVPSRNKMVEEPASLQARGAAG